VVVVAEKLEVKVLTVVRVVVRREIPRVVVENLDKEMMVGQVVRHIVQQLIKVVQVVVVQVDLVLVPTVRTVLMEVLVQI
jgi:hypothetical protein